MECELLKHPEEKKKSLETLKNSASPTSEKYKAVFTLRTFGDPEAIEYLKEAFPYVDDSNLLKHEIAYAFGQLKHRELTEEFLLKVLHNEEENEVVRHEAGEALSNFLDEKINEVLEKYVKHSSSLIAETCQLGLHKYREREIALKRCGNQYGGTIEPAPAFTVEELRENFADKFTDSADAASAAIAICEDPSIELFKKYRTIYYLRDTKTRDCLQALGKLLISQKTSPLFRHEVAFILGQLAPESEAVLDQLRESIYNESEHEIVRHESLMAVSSITKNKELIRSFVGHSSKIISDSAEVAVDLMDYW
eukprot:TRINITY_DN1736_c0_g1_i1.p1 TRINITY_DN1736_c0_g1~~TRINITY_DN1736_c0_g1_i1.p1  ORF type:complete len:309 (+),score=100.75 TRINITY_DN1736_c0_g1_i1:100-1026(+)